MKGFTRLYAEGGDILNQFYPSGAVGSNAPRETTILTGTQSIGDRGKKSGKASRKATTYNKRNILCKGSKCYSPNR